MSTTTKAQVSFRRTRSGRWAVCGPPGVVKPGATVTVTKRDGDTKTVTIEDVGKPFTGDDGARRIYGYPVELDRYGRRRRCVTGGNCSSFGDSSSCGAPDCDGFE